MTTTKKWNLLLAMMLTVVMSGWAQNPYTWSADDWSFQTGNGNITNGEIVSTNFQWGCIQLKNENSFTLSEKQIYLVVRGTTLTGNVNNPNVDKLNGTEYKFTIKGVASSNGSFVLNSTGTLMYADISSILPAATNGVRTINSIILTFNASETELPTISSIEFSDKVPVEGADMIDYGTISSLKQNVSNVTRTYDSTEGKYVAKFSSSAAEEVGLTFNTPNFTMNNTQNFCVIETNNGAINNNGSNFKCRSMFIDGTSYDANLYDMKALYTIGDRQILILSSLGEVYNENNDSHTPIFDKINGTPDNVSMSVTTTNVYFTVASTSEITIYRAGHYNLGEILEMYPELKNKNWQFVAANGLRLEAWESNNGTDNGSVRIKSDNKHKSTYEVFKQQMRSLGNMPSNFTTVNYYRFYLKDDIVPTTEDLLSSIKVFQVQLHKDMLKFFPTMTPKKVKADACRYWAYKDGEAPVKENFYVYHGNTNNVTDFTRKFLHGYNSGILPFELDVKSLPEGWTAYVFRDYTTEGDLRFEKKDYTIAANTPFFIKVPDTATEGLYVISSTNTADPIDNPANYIPTDESNGTRFVGSYINEVATNNYGTKKYGIDKSGQPMLMKSTTKTSYYRAFIAMGEQATSAKSIIFDDNTITGINDISALNDNGQTANDDAVYDLSGRKVADNYTLGIKHHALPKGIYIYKGKKIVMK